MFVAMEPRRLYRQVADQIRSLIEAGELKAGQRMPGERDLAERLGVSRPTVREALIVLEVEGYIHIRMGSGVYVNHRHPQDRAIIPVNDEDGPFEVLGARCIIEGAIAEEAARLATPQQIAQLDDNLERMAASLKDPQAVIALDRAFHTAVADIIRNPTLIRLTTHIFDQRMSPYFERLASHFEGPVTWGRALREHRTIRDAIAARDPDAAREAMRTHLANSQKRFSKSFGEADATGEA